MESNIWKKCSTCKKPIAFGSLYWACSVSTCNKKRIGLVFCSVECWDAHLPIVRHRESWSLEKRAPTEKQWRLSEEADGERGPEQVNSRTIEGETMDSRDLEKEILVVASKLKAYIRAKSDMNTSQEVMDTLSDRLRNLCDDAILRARQDGRKTVMSRDFP